jgi:hypothetical protein
MDDNERWWAYNYPKNLDRQEVPKLMVAQLVPNLRLSADPDGNFYINNVRVNGIAPAQGVSLWFLLGVLNGRVADFVFRRTAKPKDNKFFEANKQFIRNLPIPPADEGARAEVATRAEVLQQLHSTRRTVVVDIQRRAQGLARRKLPDGWLFPGLPTPEQVEADAPARFDSAARRAWAHTERERLLAVIYERLGKDLHPGVGMDATFVRGELRFFIDGVAVVEGIFLDENQGAFVLAQWKVIASTFSVTERTTGEKLADALRKVTLTAPEPVRDQIIALSRDLTHTEGEIAEAETAMQHCLYELYDLSREEIALVERG